MKFYKCVDGDRIDLIVLKHYGDLKYLKDVVEANPVLWDRSMILDNSVIVKLPDFATNDKPVKIKRERKALW